MTQKWEEVPDDFIAEVDEMFRGLHERGTIREPIASWDDGRYMWLISPPRPPASEDSVKEPVVEISLILFPTPGNPSAVDVEIWLQVWADNFTQTLAKRKEAGRTLRNKVDPQVRHEIEEILTSRLMMKSDEIRELCEDTRTRKREVEEILASGWPRYSG